ncbi:membrane protein [Xylella fastidiosa 32]|nr:membrane protein [Xylella fastidiosa 32]
MIFQRFWQIGAQLLIQPIEPYGPMEGGDSFFVQYRFNGGLKGGRAVSVGFQIRHEKNRMALVKRIKLKSYETRFECCVRRFRDFSEERPFIILGAVLGIGLLSGIGTGAALGMVSNVRLQAKFQQQRAELEHIRGTSKAQVNALAARLGELQAQANRLNALGARLTEMGKLGNGEFNFEAPVGIGGPETPANDMPVQDLKESLGQLEQQFSSSGQQLSVLASLLFNNQLEQNAVPSRAPVRNSYITSNFGRRADPFNGGVAEHKGVDFHASVGSSVMAVADGVVSYAGYRNGYGNVVDVDHSNGYLTRYAHNSRLTVKVGDLVRTGQEVAKAGSSGRSTGAHVHFEVWKDGVVMNPIKFLGNPRGLQWASTNMVERQ